MYAQYGEEIFLKKFLDINNKGLVVDIGAADGIRFSNSRFLIEQGWRALLVEPNPKNFKKIKELYNENNLVLLENVGCGNDTIEEVQFFIDKNDEHEQLSTFKIEQMNKCKSIYNCDFVETNLKIIKTSDLFEKYNILSIDFLSIDTEDFDENVIEGIDFSKVEIKLICVEHDTPKIQKKLTENNFYKVHKTIGNIFYGKTIIQ